MITLLHVYNSSMKLTYSIDVYYDTGSFGSKHARQVRYFPQYYYLEQVYNKLFNNYIVSYCMVSSHVYISPETVIIFMSCINDEARLQPRIHEILFQLKIL